MTVRIPHGRHSGRPTTIHSEAKRKKAYGISGFSFYFVILSFILNGLAIFVGELVFLLIGSVVLTVAWWLAMTSATKLSNLLKTQNEKL